MNLQPFYEFMLVMGWITVVLAGVMIVIGLVSIYHDERLKHRSTSGPVERRVGPADRRARVEPR